MTKYMMIAALLAGCCLPAEPPTQNRAEIRDMDRTERPTTPPAEQAEPEPEPPKHRHHDGDRWDRDDEAEDEDEDDDDDDD